MRELPGGPHTIEQRESAADDWETIHRDGEVYILDHPEGKTGYIIRQTRSPRIDIYAASAEHEGYPTHRYRLVDSSGHTEREWAGHLEYDQERWPMCVLLIVTGDLG